METIIAALISGLATVITAWISRQGRSPKPEQTPPQPKQQSVTAEKKVVDPGSKSNTLWWTTVMSLFALLVVCVGFFVHHDLPSMLGLLGTPAIVIILALTKPTKPWTAAAFTFGVSTIAFLTEFAVKLAHGQSIALSSNDKWLPFWILLFSAFYAFLGAAICWWKRKKQRQA